MTVDPWNQPHDRGHVGRVIGPYIGVLVGLKGDEKFIQRTLKLIASPISDEVCMYCKASQSGTNIYTLHGAGATHRSTLVSNEQFFTNWLSFEFLVATTWIPHKSSVSGLVTPG